MSIYDKISQEHNKIRSLNESIANCNPLGDETEKKRFFEELKKALLAHHHAEEKTLYSQLKLEEGSRNAADSNLDEHRDVETKLRELDKLEFNSDDWNQQYSNFIEEVLKHFQEEEQSLYREARHALSNELEDKLEAHYEENRKIAATTLETKDMQAVGIS